MVTSLTSNWSVRYHRLTLLVAWSLLFSTENTWARSLQFKNHTDSNNSNSHKHNPLEGPTVAPTNHRAHDVAKDPESPVDTTTTATKTTKESSGLKSLRTIVGNQNSPMRIFERFLDAARISLTVNTEYSDNTPYTVFIPWDTAIETLPYDWAKRLSEPMWSLHLERFLFHHIYRGALPLEVLRQVTGVKIPMMDGEVIEITTQQQKGKRIRVNENVRHLAYTAALDGYAFMVDQILVPSFMEQPAHMVAPPSLAFRWIKLGYIANLDHLLSDPAMVATFLVPSNEAFDRIDTETLTFWESTAGKEELRRVLLRHTVPQTLIASNTLAPGIMSPEETLLDGAPVIFQHRSDGVLQVNHAKVIKEDLVASNGLVHIIDHVLLPSNEMHVQMDGRTEPVMV